MIVSAVLSGECEPEGGRAFVCDFESWTLALELIFSLLFLMTSSEQTALWTISGLVAKQEFLRLFVMILTTPAAPLS